MDHRLIDLGDSGTEDADDPHELTDDLALGVLRLEYES